MSGGNRMEPFVPERRVMLVPRHIDGEVQTPLEFVTMAKAADYLGVPAHDVRFAFMQGCMVTSRKNGRSWFVDSMEEME